MIGFWIFLGLLLFELDLTNRIKDFIRAYERRTDVLARSAGKLGP